MKSFVRYNRTAILLALLYVVPAMIWVALSDSWLFTNETLSEVQRFQRITAIKSASFVLAVGVMIFFMIKLSSRKLYETKIQYKNLFERHPNPMWIYEMATLKFVSVNEAAIEHYGYTRQEFLHMTAKDIRPENEFPKVVDFVSGMQRGIEHRHRWHHIKKNGEIILVEATASDVFFEGKDCWLISIIDITEKNKKDEQIKKLSLVAENATNSMIILDEHAKVEWVNKPFVALTGYTLEEVKGLHPHEFLHGPETGDTVGREIERDLTEGRPFSGEILNYRKDGSQFWLRLTISPVWTDNEITNFVAIQTDITHIVRQNNQLRDLAFTVSHRFRKPLANILGLVNVMQQNDACHIEINYLKQSALELDAEVRLIVDKTAVIEASASEKSKSATEATHIFYESITDQPAIY